MLFIDAATYDWIALDEYAVASYWVGNYQDCAEACEKLLHNTAMPIEHLGRVHANLQFSLKALGKPSQLLAAPGRASIT
jgi:hypothetical protein